MPHQGTGTPALSSLKCAGIDQQPFPVNVGLFEIKIIVKT